MNNAKRTPDRAMALLGFSLLTLLGLSASLFAQKTPVVYVAPIEGMIDLGLAPFVDRVLREVTDAGAAAVILEINTFGGRVDAEVLIRDALLNAKVPTVAFINKRAISAGALIALAAEKIIMGDGGTIGAATPVQAGQPGGAAQPVEEKTVSYVRKEFRSTAEARKQLILETVLAAGERYASAPDKDKQWLGKGGIAVSPLRPSGIADVEGERVDVVSDGDFIEAGAQIVVSRIDGNRIVVRRQRATAEKG
jgi:membrane-bound ClpP family serine protease